MTEKESYELAKKAFESFYGTAIWDWDREGFVPAGSIVQHYITDFNFWGKFDDNDFRKVDPKRMAEVNFAVREKGVEVLNDYGKTFGCDLNWKYLDKYDAFILDDFYPLFVSKKYFTGIIEGESGFKYLSDKAEEEIFILYDEIENLKDQIKKLKFEKEAQKGSIVITSEKDLENYLVDCCEIFDWKCEKQSPREFGKGVPDRKITIYEGYTKKYEVYVEVKSPKNGALSLDQIEYHEKLRDQGYDVKVVWKKDQVDELIKELQKAS